MSSHAASLIVYHRPVVLTRKSLTLLALATAACVVTLYGKQPHAFALPQFYAEEGRFFFADAYNDGWKSLFYTANGYYHLLPRLLANLTLTLGVPYAAIPAVFVYACLPIYFVLWLKIFTRLALPDVAKAFLVLATVLVPLGNEIFMNQTNIQWVLALLPVVLYCGERPQRTWSRAADHGLLTICLFTGPYVLLIFPVLAAFAIAERQVARRAVFLAIGVVALVACALSLADVGAVDRIRGTTRASAFGYAQLAVRSYYFPVLSTFVDELPRWAVALLAALWPIAMVLAARTVFRSSNRLAMIAFCAGLSLFVATVASYGRAPALPSPFHHAIRNFYLPMVFLLWSLIAVTRFDRRRVLAWGAAFAWFAAQIPFIPETRVMPDLRWEKYAERLATGQAMRIPITPAGWFMTLEARPDRARR